MPPSLPPDRRHLTPRLRNQPRITSAILAGVVFVLTGFAAIADAQSVWSTGDALWNDPASWTPAIVPLSHDTTHLEFGGGASYTATNDLGDFTLNELVLNPTAGTITLAGDATNRLMFVRSSEAELPELTLSGAGSATISAPVVYSGNTTVTNSGSGTLLLSGNQTYGLGTKQTFINDGTGIITLADDVTYGTTGSGTGLVLNLINNNTAAGSFNIGDLGALSNMTLKIGGTGTVRYFRTGTQTEGDLFTGSGFLHVLAGATFDFNLNGEGMGGISGAGTINIRDGVSVEAAGYYEVSGKLTGAGGLGVNGGAHTLVLSGASSDYTGTTTINSGRLIVNANAPNGGTGVTGALGNATSEVLVSNTSTTTANATLLIGQAGVSIGRNIRLQSGNAGIARLGGLNDSGIVTYSGNVFLGSNGTSTTAAAAKGLTVLTTTGGTVAFTGNLLRATSFASGVTDTLTVTGGGTAILSGANTFSGATTVSGGTLVLDYTTNNGSKLSETAVLNLNGGSLDVLGNNAGATTQTVNGLTLGNSTGVLGGGGHLSVTSGIDQQATLNLGSITRNTGATMDFATIHTGSGMARITTTATNTPAGILGAYATFNRDDWAAVDGTGAITALAALSYSDFFDAGRHTSMASGIMLAGNIASHTLRLTDTAAITFTASTDTLTLESGGLLVTSTAGPTSIGGTTTATRGNLASGTGEIIVHQNSTTGILTINSVIAGATTLTKAGDGTLILTGTNTYTGGTYINGGAVQVSAAANLGAATSDVFINGGILIITANDALGSISTANRVIVIGSAGAVFDVRGTSSQSIAGGLQGTGILKKTGTGTLSVGTSANAFTGEIIIEQGVISMASPQLDNVAGITVLAGGTYQINDEEVDEFRVASGGRFVLNGNGHQGNGALRLTDQSSTNPLHNPSTLLDRGEVVLQTTSRIQVDNGSAVGSHSELRIAVNVTGAGGLIKAGTGTLVLSARDNTYAGSTEVHNGILAINSGNDRLPTGTAVILGAGTTSGVLKLNGYSQTIAGLTTSGAGTANSVVGGHETNTSLLNVNIASGSQTYAGTLGGVGTVTNAGNNHANNNLGFTKSGQGSLTLSGTNTYSGATTVEEGTLVLGNAKALGGAGAASSSSDGGTTVKAGATLDLNGQENVQEVITLNGTGVGGAGALVNNNTGMTASVGNGVASLSAPSTTPTAWSGAGAVTIAPPVSETGMPAAATAQFGLSSANFTITNSGSNNFSLTNSGVTVSGGNGSGAVLTLSLGVTSASYVATYATGSTPTTWDVAPNVTLQNGATGEAILDGSGKIVGINVTNPGSGFVGTPTVTIVAGTGTVRVAGTNPSFSSSSTSNFIVVGVNVVNAGTGYTSAPTVTITRSGGTTATAVANDTNFVLNGFALTDSGSGYDTAPTVSVNGGTATVVANLSSIVLESDSSVGGAGNLILNPVISGEHGLTKVGAGVTTLAGNNVYTGDTTVSEGTLLAANLSGSATGAGNVTVQSGATLGGTGFIGRAAGSAAQPESNINITVATGAKLMVGNTHGLAFFQGGNASTLVLQAGGDGTTSGVISLLGTVQFDIYDRDEGANDPLYANDLLDLNSANQVILSGILQVRDTTGTSLTTWAIGDSWQLFDWSGIIPEVNHSGGFYAMELPDLAVGLKWDTSNLYTTGIITVAIVPEPSRAVLLVLAFSAALFRRRRSC